MKLVRILNRWEGKELNQAEAGASADRACFIGGRFVLRGFAGWAYPDSFGGIKNSAE